MEEKDVGILCYISQLPGFRGILKQRYSDFIVNEVDLDGNVVHLTSFDVPMVCFRRMEEKILVHDDCANIIESFKLLACEDDAKSLKFFLDQILSGSENHIAPLVLSPDSEKAHRTEIHNFFKKNFDCLVTDTIEGPDSLSKCIRIRYYVDVKNGRRNCRKRKIHEKDGEVAALNPFDDRGSDNWPEGVGKFLRFHLYKENKDTQEALGLLGKMLGIQQRSFGFAGTKDKRAISTQKVTVFKRRAEDLASLNDKLIGIKVGNFCYVDEGLVLGQLRGNQFTITLRGIVAESDNIIRDAATALGKEGFINYFGLQRFGSGSVPTHHVGAALLQGRWKEAIDLILDPREGERTTIKEAREYYKQSGDVDGTLRKFPHYLVAERSILSCLKKCPGNYLQALKAIPRTLRMMYIHSYQSYLWNHAASARVQMFGVDTVVVGDLVCRKDCFMDANTDYDSSDEVPNAVPDTKVHSVHVVSDDDLRGNTYTIDDVVLPLPGSSIIYPSNDVATIYEEIANNDSISLGESSHNVKEFSITNVVGCYRRLLQRPINYSWDLVDYKGPCMPLAEADMDLLSKCQSHEDHLDKENSALSQMDCHKNEAAKVHVQCEVQMNDMVGSINCGDGPSQVALRLTFILPTSCYATMAIRELLKSSTSAAYQKSLS